MPLYVCPIIGAGTDRDPYRPAIADDRLNYSAEIQTGVDGTPISSWCVVSVADVTVRVKQDADGKTALDTEGKRVLEQVSHDVVLSRAGVEAVVSLEDGRRVIEEKKRGSVRAG